MFNNIGLISSRLWTRGKDRKAKELIENSTRDFLMTNSYLK